MTIAPNDFTHLHAHRVTLASAGSRSWWTRRRAGMDFDGDHRPRCPLRRGRLSCMAARNKGIKPIIVSDVARRSMTDKEGKADAQPCCILLALLPLFVIASVPARDRRPHRRLRRLQAAHRPRAPGQSSEGLIGLSSCLSGRDPAKALEVEDWELALEPGRRIRRHLRQGTPRTPGPRHARPASAQRAAAPACARLPAGRDQRPPLRSRGPVRGARRPALRSAPATTSTRRTG